MIPRRRSPWLIACVLLTAWLCGPAGASGSTLSPAFEPSVRELLTETAAPDSIMWDLARWRAGLSGLYARRAHAQLWVRDGRLTSAATQLLQELKTADRRGLLPADYDVSGLPAEVVRLAGNERLQARELALLDVRLSVLAARIASDLHSGRVSPAEMGYDLDVKQSGFDVAQAVESVATSADVARTLDSLEPVLRHYALLKAALADYRALDTRSATFAPLPQLPRLGVRGGESYSGAAVLRDRLIALGDLHAPASPGERASTVLDDELVVGLERFQTRHGLEPDGVLGRATLRALDTPISARIQQIELSLERVRWLPAQLDSPPIIVNIPQFRLFAFRTTQDFAEDILQMDVIVGSTFPGRRTPVFAADMQYVVLQPYWDVPRSILLKEMLPDIEADPTWVERKGFEIVRGGGDDARPLPATTENVQLLARGVLRLRQKPGKENALGHVKFMFPNRHSVYLHDTPARALFSRSRRAFSHGCIRVADPMALLAHVMRDDPTWNEERRDRALAQSTPTRVSPTRPIRVFIVYGTALAIEAGTVLFFDDIYGQDAPLIGRIASRRARAIATETRRR